MVGHLRHRVCIADDHIEVGQRAQGGAIQQRAAALDAAKHGALQGSAEYGLGNGVHG
ncbi:hypothetical protein D3C76_1597270 [compost metagenome]